MLLEGDRLELFGSPSVLLVLLVIRVDVERVDSGLEVLEVFLACLFLV